MSVRCGWWRPAVLARVHPAVIWICSEKDRRRLMSDCVSVCRTVHLSSVWLTTPHHVTTLPANPLPPQYVPCYMCVWRRLTKPCVYMRRGVGYVYVSNSSRYSITPDNHSDLVCVTCILTRRGSYYRPKSHDFDSITRIIYNIPDTPTFSHSENKINYRHDAID